MIMDILTLAGVIYLVISDFIWRSKQRRVEKEAEEMTRNLRERLEERSKPHIVTDWGES